MFDILKKFESKYAPLQKKGMRVNGFTIIDVRKKTHAIKISRPFIFDNRLVPKRYEGVQVKSQIQGDLPEEFTIDRSNPDWAKQNYIWAPERFEKFVDRCGNEIKVKLENPKMTRKEMLDAICFGDFEEHKIKSQQLIKEGKIPAYKKK